MKKKKAIRRKRASRPMTERERAKAASALRSMIDLVRRRERDGVIRIVKTKKRRRQK